MNTLAQKFDHIAKSISEFMGRPYAFFGAILFVIVWGCSGPIFHFSQVWQLVINTSTTIVTFLLLFLVQSTQNRDTKAVHKKLDELIKTSKAHNDMMGIEELSTQEIEQK